MPGPNQIALSVQPMQLADPLDQYAKATRVGNMIQQSREHAQRMEHTGLQIDKQRRDAADEENWRGAFTEGGGNSERTVEAAMRRNVNPATIQKYRKQIADDVKRKAEQEKLDFDNTASLTQELFDAHEFVAGLPAEQRDQGYDMKTQELLKRGSIKPEHVKRYDPATFELERAMVTTQANAVKKAAELRAQEDAKRAAAKEAHEVAMRPAQEAKTESDALTAANAAELGGLKVQGREPEQPHEKAVREATEKRDKATRTYQNARLGLQSGKRSEERKAQKNLAQVVLDNPNLYDELTPTEKGHVAADLAAGGFTGFGKPLPPAAVRQLSESRSAITSLKDLREVLKSNEQYIGPIAGLQALNPYSDARKAQANIDMVRQRVGKALEGGVLRKEDEEKYKKILATLRDTPETAIYKVDQLVQNIGNDIAAFTDEYRRAGRKVTDPVGEKPGGAEKVKVWNPKTNKFE